jgi:alpha-D-ribose 1-methylphosphonate 5-triphosphate synthase subunit PhnH
MQREIHYDEVFDAQAHYRIILDAMARPGKVCRLPVLELDAPEGIHSASLLTGFALLNADVSFAVPGREDMSIGEYISLNTSSRHTEAEHANFVFLQGGQVQEIAHLKMGTLSYPEESATLIVDVAAISGGPLPGALALELSGPGVNGSSKVYVDGLNVFILRALRQQNLEFPLGIDAIFTDTEQRIFCIPRTSRIII